MSGRLLARYAECVFWLARYVERAENLARILEIQETFARDSKGGNDWGIVLAINADAERFLAAHPGGVAADAVLDFYVLDRRNPTSLISDLANARENARTLRPLISTEMWIQLNVFYNRIASLEPSEVTEERLARLCALVKEGCDTHAGITAGTFYRDEAACFYNLGAAIECADQTTRLLDAKFLGLKPRPDTAPGSAIDVSYWTALLRSAAGYQAYRRLHPLAVSPEHVAAFMVCDPAFPRSVACNLGAIGEELTRLRRHYRLKPAAGALELLDELTATLDVANIREALARGELSLFTDEIQRSLASLTDHLATSFFGHGARPARSQAMGGMAQSQGAGGMTQTMGGMTQSLGDMGRPPRDRG